MRPLRNIEKDWTYLITKKTNDDYFFLVPEPMTNVILMFAMLAFTAKHDLEIHGFCFLSNHFHLIVTDRKGNLPDFMREFLSNSSKALKLHLGEDRSIWSSRRYSAVRLLDLNAAEQKLAYTILNPTRAELSATPGEWPGVTSAAWTAGDFMTAVRPSVYFSSNTFPDDVSVQLTPVSVPFGEDVRRSEARIAEIVCEKSFAVQREVEAKGATFAGVESILRTSRVKRSSHPVSEPSPRFASKNRELLKRAIAEDIEFHVRHAIAKAKYIAGDHDVLFPAGTYGYRVVFGVNVERKQMSA